MQPAIPTTLPIQHLDWPLLVPAMGRANRAISQYSGLLRYMPDASLLTTPLTTREAVLSSRIEGTYASVTDVLRSEAGEDTPAEEKRKDIEEIVNYRRALNTAERGLKKRPFNLNLMLEIHRTLMTSVRGQNRAPGEFRRVQNYIGRTGAPVSEASFIPPTPPVMMHALGEWEKYYHADDRDVLVQLAVIHAQFEFLHPFLDGNGRLGRILIPLFLFNKGVLTTPTFYLSEYLEEHREQYVDHLRELKSPSGWTRWCLFFLQAIEQQAEWNSHRIEQILRLYQKKRDVLLNATNTRAALIMLDAMFAQPIFRAAMLTERAGMPTRAMVLRILAQLVDQGDLKILAERAGRRPAIYSLHQLVRIAEAKPKSSKPL